MKYWLVKSEPESYSWDDFVKLGRDHWDGVRNYQARNFMQEMAVGDQVLFYHSGKAREVVGLAEVLRTAYQDPTTDDDRWVAVDMAPIRPLKRFVSLAEIKADERLTEIKLIKNSRLSVMPLQEAEYGIILALAGE